MFVVAFRWGNPKGILEPIFMHVVGIVFFGCFGFGFVHIFFF